MPSRKTRPILVGIIALIYMFIGILVIILGIPLIAGLEIFTDVMPQGFEGLVTVFGLTFIIGGLIIFLIGFGLWKLNFLAWLITVILYGITTLSYVLNYQGLLLALQTGSLELLLPPLVTIILFFYFIGVREKFT